MKKIKLVNIAALVTIIFVATIVATGKDILLSFKEPMDFYADDFDVTEDHDGDRLIADIPFCLGECATEVTTKSSYGSTSKTETHYYIIPAVVPDDDYYYYMCIKVYEKDKKKFDDLTDLTMTGEYGSLKVDGRLTKLEDEAFDYMVDLFKEADYFTSDEELEHYLLPLCFESVNYSFAKGALVVAIVSFIASIALWIAYFKSRSNEKAKLAAHKATLQANFPEDSFDENVFIGGQPYPKHLFESINASIESGETIAAISNLRQITGIGLEEAKEVIDNWSFYYKI